MELARTKTVQERDLGAQWVSRLESLDVHHVPRYLVLASMGKCPATENLRDN